MHYMRMRPHAVQARCVMRTRSSTERVIELFAGMRRRASASNCLREMLRRIAMSEAFELGGCVRGGWRMM